MTCLLCRYFQPIEPPQHKADREAGKCRKHCGKEWDQHTAINHVKNHPGQPLDGWCRLAPTALRKRYGDICSEISVREYFFTGWGVEAFEPNDNLFEWAEQSLQTVLYGSWQRRHAEQLEKDNAKLREQLKQLRKISASRLKRLREAKPTLLPAAEPTPTTEAPVQVYPRLVAAE